MNKFYFTMEVEAETPNLPENELGDMLSTSLAEGAEMNMDETTKIKSITVNYRSEIKGSKTFNFAKDEQPVDGLGFES